MHGGAHKLNNTLGQALVAKKMGKTRLIAETGAGQHGVATAIVGANLGFETQVYMGEVDIERQKMNVYRMELMGAEVIPVRSGSRTLKDAINEAMRDWAASFDHTHYLLGTAAGAHPFPSMVRDFQSVIGQEARKQIQEAEGRLPDSIVACVGGGSNAMGIFAPFLKDEEVRLMAVEAGGRGPGKNERMADNGASLRLRHRRRPARCSHQDPAGPLRPDSGVVFRGSRPGLSRRGPGAGLSGGDGQGAAQDRR